MTGRSVQVHLGECESGEVTLGAWGLRQLFHYNDLSCEDLWSPQTAIPLRIVFLHREVGLLPWSRGFQSFISHSEMPHLSTRKGFKWRHQLHGNHLPSGWPGRKDTGFPLAHRASRSQDTLSVYH